MQRSDGLQLNEELQQRIEEFARMHGMTPTEVVRAAFEEFEHTKNGGTAKQQPFPSGETVYDRLKQAGVIGCIDDPNLPADLSTNKAYFEGFGRD